MITKVVMEALSPTMEEGRIITWHKKEGDEVTVGDIIAEVETDKAVMELQARGDGILRKIVAGEGATVEVGKLVAVIAGADDDIGDVGATAPAPAAESTAEASQPVAAEPPPTAAPPAPAGGRIKASPLARRMAREQRVDLESVQGSGPGGRIVKRDLTGAAGAAPTIAPAGVVSPGGFEDVSLGQMRKTIAKRLAQSIGPVPHFFLTTEVDMERAAAARAELNALGDQRISFNDIAIKVVAMALMQHRACNAWWQDDHIRYFNEVHMGMAVAVEDGLITPVIRNANLKTLRDIASESRALAERARERRLQPEEYTGATFSISNLGMFGIDEFTAIINPPEAGIIAVGALMEKPVALDGALVVRRRMRLTMSCDHRVIDGATGAQFLQTVTTMLENPMAMVW
ncbi:MAG: dihydrolipoamide acetyltransferase family protein [Gemmatimonadales bacterium]